MQARNSYLIENNYTLEKNGEEIPIELKTIKRKKDYVMRKDGILFDMDCFEELYKNVKSTELLVDDALDNDINNLKNDINIIEKTFSEVSSERIKKTLSEYFNELNELNAKKELNQEKILLGKEKMKLLRRVL